MDFDFFGNFGGRELVMGLAIILGVYSGIVIIRLSRMSRPREGAPPVWKQDPAQFGEQVLKSGMEAELAELRQQVTALKEEVDKLKAARAVSPQYNEAVGLAQQGLEAQVIAERCGISVAEAELVRALASRPNP